MNHLKDLVSRLNRVQQSIHGCESLTVASSDGLILATTMSDPRGAEFLAAMTSFLLASVAKGLAPCRAGACRSLDFRGDRQVLIQRLPDIDAYLVCVLQPGVVAVNADDPALRGVTAAVPGLLHAEGEDQGRHWLLQRDKTCLVPIKGRTLLGRAWHCDVLLQSSRVAPEHVLLEVVAGQLQATDLGGEHGTKHNGRGFTGTIRLEVGDRLTLPRSSSFVVCARDIDGRELGRDGKPVGKRTTRRVERPGPRAT